MPSIPINIFTPEGGLNASLATNRIADQDASETSNMLYERGIMKTPFGFSIITSNGMPLPGSEPVHGIWQFSELSGQETLVAVTRTKIFRRDLDSDDWADVSNASTPIDSNFNHPVSFVEVAHTDGIGPGSDEYYHLLVCDGGNSPIQRWPGESEATFSDLLGGADYHTGSIHTGHYARQVGLFKNHTILMSPLEDLAGKGLLTEQPQRIRWSDTGTFDTGTWDDTATAGASQVLLLDTSDFNVRMALLGEVLTVYQRNSIWGMIFVGGNTAFDPRVLVQSVGLLAPGLLISYRNIHYFVGNDFNVYEYFGGGVIRDVSAPKSIADRLKDDLDATVIGHARMGMEAKGRRLHIGVVREGDNHVRRVYTRNMTTGAWGIHDYSNYTTAATGITAITLAGSERSVIGETYEELADRGTKYVESFGLVPSSETNPNWSEAASEHVGATSLKPTSGTVYGTYWTEVTQAANDWTTSTTYTLGNVVLDGVGGSTSAGHGQAWICIKTHDSTSTDQPGHDTPTANFAKYWVRLDLPRISAIATVVDSTTQFDVTFASVHGLDADWLVAAKARSPVDDKITFRDCSGTPAIDGEKTIDSIQSTTVLRCSTLNVTGSGTSGNATLCKFRNGHTYFPSDKAATTDYVKYSDWMFERFAEESMIIGDQAGNIYAFDDADTNWAGTSISALHETKEHDFDMPARRKRFQQVVIEAKGTSVILGYSVDRAAYTDFTARTLTSDWKLYRFYINLTGHNCRLRFKDSSGSDFQVRSYGFPNVQVQDFA
jgi:hypothetical protein